MSIYVRRVIAQEFRLQISIAYDFTVNFKICYARVVVFQLLNICPEALKISSIASPR